MMRRADVCGSKRWFAAVTVSLTLVLAAGSVQTALALREGVLGNTPIADPGWPKGAAAVFNNSARIGYWVGPGPGYYCAEYSGDARALSVVLADFATIQAKSRRLVVCDGVRARLFAHKMDWGFNVWVPAEWERPTSASILDSFHRDPNKCPPPEIIVYTGGNVHWSDVIVPKNIEVVDERLEAHGFTLADGTVLEGKVVDLATQQPLPARISVDRLAPKSKDTGEIDYTPVAETVADSQGHWVLKNVPADWRRLMLTVDGYMPRWLDNRSTDSQPGWYFYDRGLSRPVIVSGRTIDEAGRPLADVEVRLEGDIFGPNRDYWPTNKFVAKTDADGRFRFEQVSVGNATIRVRSTGYCLPGVIRSITTPADDVVLGLVKSVQVCVTVDFTGTSRRETYVVEIQPEEGGAALPTWEQLRNHVTLVHDDHFATDGLRVEIRPIDANNQVRFNGIPPARYVLQGWPSRFGPAGRSTPFSGIERSKPHVIDVKSGQSVEIRLPAK